MHRVLRPPGGGSSIMIGDDTPPPPQRATAARSPFAVEGDGVVNPNKAAKDYTPSKPFGTQADVDNAKGKFSPQVSQTKRLLCQHHSFICPQPVIKFNFIGNISLFILFLFNTLLW